MAEVPVVAPTAVEAKDADVEARSNALAMTKKMTRSSEDLAYSNVVEIGHRRWTLG